MAHYSIEPRIGKSAQGYIFLSFGRNLSEILDAATKTGLDALKTTTKKVVHKAAKATAEFIGNKIADKTVKSKPGPNVNSRDVEEIIIPTVQREKILRQVL